MEAVVFFKDGYSDARAEQLVRLAASRDWIGLSGRDGWAAGNASRRPDLVAAPRGWELGAAGTATTFYDGEFDLAPGEPAGVGRDEWVTIRNGRYAAAVGAEALETVKRETGGDIILISVDRALVSYRERLVANGSGRVLGFRRFYHDAVAPTGLGKDWPALVLARTQRVLESGMKIGGSLSEAVERWRGRGFDVNSVVMGGEAYDLSEDWGLVSYWRSRCGRSVASGTVGSRARVEGDAIIEDGASVEEGAIVVGPAFIGAGAVVGQGAVVTGSVVGPGARIAKGAVIRDRVVMSGEEPAAAKAPAGARPVDMGRTKADAFREWPLFSYARLGKRVVDIAGAIAALAFLITIFPIAAIAIRLNSRGPILYTHRRQGRHGKEFSCLKFRTMVSDADLTREELRAINEVDGPQFKVEHDPRITLVGDFLRETNIDEIPQFLNVLAGQMSIVGPRPSPDEENQMCPAWREARLSVRPGITGPWQVYRSAERKNDFQEWIYYDTMYVRTLSFRQDLVIMAKTVGVILGGFAQLFVAKRGTQTAAGAGDSARPPESHTASDRCVN